MKKFKTLLIIGATAVLFWVVSAQAHETENWKHLNGSTGPCIGMRYCDYSIQLWDIDFDGDGKVDSCRALILAHDKFHYQDIKPRYKLDQPATCNCEDIK